MASGPITSWQIDGKKVEIVSDFIFLGSKILLLGKKAKTNLDSTFKSGDTTLQTKVRLVKAMFFSSSHV